MYQQLDEVIIGYFKLGMLSVQFIQFIQFIRFIQLIQPLDLWGGGI